MSNCCCGGSHDEKLKKLQEVIKVYKDKKGALIPVLQGAQDIYGYLPEEAFNEISEKLRIPLSKIYGVATFYSQFHLEPRGKNIIRVCLGTACHVRGGAKIFEKIQEELQINDGETTPDLKFTLESVACIGACGLSPVIMINDDTHGRLTVDQIPKILAQYE